MRKLLLTDGMGQAGNYPAGEINRGLQITVLDALPTKGECVPEENVRLLEEDPGARGGNLEKLIYIGQVAVCAKPEHPAVKEKHSYGPVFPYSASEVMQREHCTMYYAAYWLPAACICQFNIYSLLKDLFGSCRYFN